MSQISLVGGCNAIGEKINLTITDQKITDISYKVPVSGAHVIDVSGSILIPGLVDLHTHLREPGKEDAETVASGARCGRWRFHCDFGDAKY